MPWQFSPDLRCFYFYGMGVTDLSRIEVDEDVPMAGQQVDLEEAIAATYTPEKGEVTQESFRPVAQCDMSTVYPQLIKKARDFRGFGSQVVLVPTLIGLEQGLKPLKLVYRLLDWNEANRYAQHLSVEVNFLVKDMAKLMTIKTFEVGANDMGGVNYQFDPRQYEPEQWGGSHPAGNFEARISGTEIAANSQGDGSNFIVEFTTESGSIKKWYPLWSRNEKAARGAHNQLTALCYAIGYMQPLSMHDEGKAIIGGQCKLQIGKQAESDYMEIKKIFDMQGNVPGKGASAQQNHGNTGQQQGMQGGQGGFQGQGHGQSGFQGQGFQGGNQGGGFQGGQGQGQQFQGNQGNGQFQGGQGQGGFQGQGHGQSGFQGGQGNGQFQGGQGQGGGFQDVVGKQGQGGQFQGQGQGQGFQNQGGGGNQGQTWDQGQGQTDPGWAR